jgi:hypothetical protein
MAAQKARPDLLDLEVNLDHERPRSRHQLLRFLASGEMTAARCAWTSPATLRASATASAQ